MIKLIITPNSEYYIKHEKDNKKYTLVEYYIQLKNTSPGNNHIYCNLYHKENGIFIEYKHVSVYLVNYKPIIRYSLEELIVIESIGNFTFIDNKDKPIELTKPLLITKKLIISVYIVNDGNSKYTNFYNLSELYYVILKKIDIGYIKYRVCLCYEEKEYVTDIQDFYINGKFILDYTVDELFKISNSNHFTISPDSTIINETSVNSIDNVSKNYSCNILDRKLYIVNKQLTLPDYSIELVKLLINNYVIDTVCLNKQNQDLLKLYQELLIFDITIITQ